MALSVASSRGSDWGRDKPVALLDPPRQRLRTVRSLREEAVKRLDSLLHRGYLHRSSSSGDLDCVVDLRLREEALTALAFGERHIETCGAQYRTGSCYCRFDMWPQALLHAKKALQTWNDIFTADAPEDRRSTSEGKETESLCRLQKPLRSPRREAMASASPEDRRLYCRILALKARALLRVPLKGGAGKTRVSEARRALEKAARLASIGLNDEEEAEEEEEEVKEEGGEEKETGKDALNNPGLKILELSVSH